MSMVKKRPQLSLEELSQLKTLLGGVLGLLSAWTVAFMDINAWLLLAGVTAAGLAVLARPELPARLPAWVHRLAFPVIVATLVFDLVVFREPLPAFIRLNLMLIGYRLVAPRKRRDDLQLVVLGLFMVVVAGVLSVSLLFAVQILAFTACALGFLLAITLVDAGGGPRTSAATLAHPGWGGLLRRVAATTDWRLAVLGTGLFAGVVLVSGLLFLAIPRFELSNSFFLDRLINRQTRTGFSDEIRFGEVTDIQRDNRLALSVDVSDRTQVPADPYWRMVVLDEYVAGGFRVSSALRTALNRSVMRTTRLTGTGRFRPGAAAWTFYVEPGISRYLPLLGDFQVVTFTEPQAVSVSDPLNVVALQRDPPRMFAYRVSSMLAAPVLPDADFALNRRKAGADAGGAGLLGPALSAADRARLTDYNRAISGGVALGPEEYVWRASRWLASQHSYSLQSTVPAGEGDPLVRWIGSTEPGHCELFAGALVLLAREAGHPARLVTGFRGGSWNGFSESFTVRNANAHAWVEVFDDAAGGWRRADPTPGAPTAAEETRQETEDRLQRLADSSWSARLESLRVFWYRRIVNFDQDTQIELARAAKEAVDETGRKVRAWLERTKATLLSWWERPWNTGRFAIVAAVILGAAGVVWGWRIAGRGWWLRWRSQAARSPRTDPVRKEAGRWLARLNAAKLEGQGVRAELERLRFGPRETWANPARVFLRARQVWRARSR